MFHLAWFLSQGYGPKSWRSIWPGSASDLKRWMMPDIFIDLAKGMERACMDYMIIEDGSLRSRSRQERNMTAIESWTIGNSFDQLSASLLNRQRFNRLLAVGFAMFAASSVADGVGRAGVAAGPAGERARSVATESADQSKAQPETAVATIQAAHRAPEPSASVLPVVQAGTAAEPPPLPVVLYLPRSGR
jgi:hypothetical protein